MWNSKSNNQIRDQLGVASLITDSNEGFLQKSGIIPEGWSSIRVVTRPPPTNLPVKA
jgi:hypothetical protein